MAISIEDLPRLSDEDREALDHGYVAVEGVPAQQPAATVQRRPYVSPDLSPRFEFKGDRDFWDGDDRIKPLEEVPVSPLRSCGDCQLNLGRDVLRALGSCPRWGLRRAGIETRCASFIPKPNPPCRLP